MSYEPSLKKYLRESIKTKKIRFTDDLLTILKTDITFITVRTPSHQDGKINLTALNKVTSNLAKILKEKKSSDKWIL